MAFKPNYRQQRSDRDRSTRSKQDEKLQKLMERSAKRKAEREAAGLPPEAEGTEGAAPVPEGEQT
jgi:hypothetical protein